MKSIYIILIIILTFSCENSKKSTETHLDNTTKYSNNIEVTKAQFDSEKMTLGHITEQSFTETVKVNGMIDVPPHNKSTVSTFVGGYITKTPLLVGDVVKKGQLLVTLENPEFVEIQQEYLEVSEQIQYLKSEYDRQKTLHDENITSQKNFLKAQSTYKSTLALYNGLRKKLQMMNISPSSVEKGQLTSTINLYAPISGHITKVNVSNGSYVSASNVILEIIDVDHIHLELSVYEKDILKIKKGQSINFTIPEASNKTFTADVHLVGTTIDETTRRVKVHGHIDNKDTQFIVGMFVDAQIQINQETVLAIPQEAVIKSGNEFYILVLKEKSEDSYVFQKTLVKIGKQTEEHIEIIKPEKITENKILIKGTNMLFNENEVGHSH